MKRSTTLAAIAMTAGLLGVSHAASAAIINLDLRIQGQSGPAAKTASVSAGQTVTLDVYAVLLGANSDSNTSNDGVVSMSMRFTSIEGLTPLLGDLKNPVKNESFGFGGVGSSTNYDANADLEWGGAFPTTNSTGYFNPGGTNLVTGNAVGSDVEVFIGTIQWQASATVSNGATTSLQVLPFVNSSTSNGSFSVRINNSNTSNQNAASNIGQANPVTLTTVPEPTLIGTLAACSLFALRRRTRRRV